MPEEAPFYELRSGAGGLRIVNRFPTAAGALDAYNFRSGILALGEVMNVVLVAPVPGGFIDRWLTLEELTLRADQEGDATSQRSVARAAMRERGDA